MARRQKMVTLVTTDILTPYKKDEVFTVNEETAEKLLKTNLERTDFGPRYPKVKVRLFDEKRDRELLLENRYLNQEEHDELLKEIRPDLWAIELAERQEDGDYEDEAEDEAEAADTDAELVAASKPAARKRRNARQ